MMTIINDVSKYFDKKTFSISELSAWDLALGYSLQAYINLRVGLGGGSESFFNEVEELIATLSEIQNDLIQLNHKMNVIKPRPETANKELKPYVNRIKDIQIKVVSLVKRGW